MLTLAGTPENKIEELFLDLLSFEESSKVNSFKLILEANCIYLSLLCSICSNHAILSQVIEGKINKYLPFLQNELNRLKPTQTYKNPVNEHQDFVNFQ